MVTNFTPQGDDSVQLWASAKDLELVSYVLPLASGSQRVAQRSLGDNAFPRSGLDVAVIRDLGARSIPGWGMLIFSLEALSYNASVDRPSVKSESAALIMHQVLLQWFFAYVTPRSEHDAWMGDALAYAFKRSLLQEQNPRSGQSWRHRLLDRCAVMHAEDIGRPPVWLKPGLII
ncbi:conserved hypothetical protein [Ixodes scapularis]|uniref:Peptidase M1 membrane alanine aminopeptidase domain-containing protein n=1 Tax=Ixodes scapularis TaxID=6945 RepID=B7Q091_IXOSC|nr:conserved hypothetical protein [Ixodes scapularis]|eukprot:XP_002407287.1 conserved hypothetical protein [Ixodes scapularis]